MGLGPGVGFALASEWPCCSGQRRRHRAQRRAELRGDSYQVGTRVEHEGGRGVGEDVVGRVEEDAERRDCGRSRSARDGRVVE